VMQLRQIAPGMVQQIQRRCGNCNGTGKVINASLACRTCRGKKVVKERKVLELHIEKGMASGDHVTFRGEADEAPGMEAGDVIFIVDEKPHDEYKRHNDDLVLKKDITLVEALCGLEFPLELMDGRTLKVSSAEGEVITPGAIKMIANEGMPVRGSGGFQKGRLFLQFNIVFPEEGFLSSENMATLESVLPARPTFDWSGEEEDSELMTIEGVKIGGEGRGGRRGASDEDEEGEGMHGQRVQCQNCIM